MANMESAIKRAPICNTIQTFCMTCGSGSSSTGCMIDNRYMTNASGEANEPRVAAAKKIMKYKNAQTTIEIEQKIKAENTEANEADVKELIAHKCGELEKKGLLIKQWNLDFLGADLNWCGRSGSPTKVHRIQSIVLAAKESKDIEPNEKGITDMIHKLIEDKTIA